MSTAAHAFLWWGVFVLGSTLLMYASVLVWLAPALVLKLLAAIWRALRG